MNMYDLNYLYDNEYAKDLIDNIKKGPKKIIDLGIRVVANATILPGRTDIVGCLPWGAGGVLDEQHQFVPESGVFRAFGGSYEYDSSDNLVLEEKVIHINVIPKHWGHFIVDVICRLWIILESDPDIRITYCGWKWGDEGIKGNFLEFFKLLGIEEKRLLYIKEPTRVREVIIPEAAFRFDGSYHDKYKTVIRKVCDNVVNYCNDIKYPSKIYLTRTQLNKARFYETGEIEIEEAFRNNGYVVIAPEKLSLTEQICLFQKADIVASLSGTLPHNIIFSKIGTDFVILNRTCTMNPPQLGLNWLFERKVTYIDVYHRVIENKPVLYGEGPLWVECNEKLCNWFEDNGYSFTEPISMIKTVKIKNYLKWSALRVCHFIYKKRTFKKIMKKRKGGQYA